MNGVSKTLIILGFAVLSILSFSAVLTLHEMSPAKRAIPLNIATMMVDNTFMITSDEVEGSATGFWVDDRHVITNCHVAAETGHTVYMTHHDEVTTFEGHLIACDEDLDLAMYKSWWPNHSAHEMSFTSETPSVGTLLYSSGYGKGKRLSFKTGVTGLSYTLGEAPAKFLTLEVTEMIMPIVVGDSGSPVFNSKGEIVGVAEAFVNYKNYWGQSVPVADKSQATSIVGVKRFLKKVKLGAYELPEV